MTRLLFASLLLVLTACQATPRFDVELDERAASWAHAIKHTYSVHTPGGHGSGWAYDEDTLITCEHVVGFNGPRDMFIQTDAAIWTVTDTYCIPGVDGVAIDVSGPPLNVPTVRYSELQPGEFVSMSGYPTMFPVVTWGYVAGSWYYHVAVDGAVLPGMSGGPVFDTSGQLVGMNVATTTPPGRALGIIIPITSFYEGIDFALGYTDPTTEGSTVGRGG